MDSSYKRHYVKWIYISKAPIKSVPIQRANNLFSYLEKISTIARYKAYGANTIANKVHPKPLATTIPQIHKTVIKTLQPILKIALPILFDTQLYIKY